MCHKEQRPNHHHQLKYREDEDDDDDCNCDDYPHKNAPPCSLEEEHKFRSSNSHCGSEILIQTSQIETPPVYASHNLKLDDASSQEGKDCLNNKSAQIRQQPPTDKEETKLAIAIDNYHQQVPLAEKNPSRFQASFFHDRYSTNDRERMSPICQEFPQQLHARVPLISHPESRLAGPDESMDQKKVFTDLDELNNDTNGHQASPIRRPDSPVSDRESLSPPPNEQQTRLESTVKSEPLDEERQCRPSEMETSGARLSLVGSKKIKKSHHSKSHQNEPVSLLAGGQKPSNNSKRQVRQTVSNKRNPTQTTKLDKRKHEQSSGQSIVSSKFQLPIGTTNEQSNEPTPLGPLTEDGSHPFEDDDVDDDIGSSAHELAQSNQDLYRYHLACHQKHLTKLTEQQIEQLKQLINIIRCGNYNEFIDVLEKQGFKRNLLNVFVNGQTALHYSLIHGRSLAWCKQLILNGANPNLTNRAGWHPIHLAAYSCSKETMLYLLDCVTDA